MNQKNTKTITVPSRHPKVAFLQSQDSARSCQVPSVGGLLISKGKPDCNSKRNWLSPFFRVYVLQLISKEREIKCEKCGVYEGLEIHHKKYGPIQNVSIDDISLLCNQCHRQTSHRLSSLKTVFEDGKRFCLVSGHKFEY